MTSPSPAVPRFTWSQISWGNTAFIVATHLAALAGTALYVALHGVTLPPVLLGAFFMLACGFSVTAGYHRLFAHATYEAHPLVRAFYLLFGAAAFENSALKWASDHRRHHAYVDRDEDPYNVKLGFWWAHIGWIFLKDPPGPRTAHTGDLEGDRLVRWQDRFYAPLAVGLGLLLPLGLGFLFGDPWGGLVVGGFLRIVLLHHATFSINSVAHTIGRQPYSTANSSRDSGLTALLTLGEGYHNFHHTFPTDYRNGVRKFHFDPTKWLIYGLSLVGLARRLMRVPDPVILKARLRTEAQRAERGLADRPHLADRLRQARQKLEAMLDRWNTLKAQWAEERARLTGRSREMLASLRRELVETRRRYFEAYRLWFAPLGVMVQKQTG